MGVWFVFYTERMTNQEGPEQSRSRDLPSVSRKVVPLSSMSSEAETGWTSCEVPRLMFLGFEDSGNQGLISRELRLFACACCRRINDFITDERSWQAVNVAERYADGNATPEELKIAYDSARLAEKSIKQRIKQINSAGLASVGGQDIEEWRLFKIDDWHPEGRRLNAACAASHCAQILVMSNPRNPELKYCGDWLVARAAALHAYIAAANRDRLESMEAAFLAEDAEYLKYEDPWQADLVRCVFRNPFRPTTTGKLDTVPRIRKMAESIYQLRGFNRMPALGKELVDTGCLDSDLLSHCFDSFVHARGCWALDLARGLERKNKTRATDNSALFESPRGH